MVMAELSNIVLSIKQKINRITGVVSQQVSRIPQDTWKTIFFGVLFAYTAVLVFVSIGYTSAAGLFPLIIGLPLLGMLLVNMILIHNPTKYTSGSVGLFDNISDEALSEQVSDNDVEESDVATRVHREITMTLWILGVLALIWLFGFLNAFLVFIFLFIYLHEGSLIRAGTVTVLSLIFIYALFIELLALPLPEGVLLGSLFVGRPIQGATND